MLTLLLTLSAFAQESTSWVLLGANTDSGAVAYATLENHLGVQPSATTSPPCVYLGLRAYPYQSVTLHLTEPMGASPHQSWTVVQGSLTEDMCTTTEAAVQAVADARSAYSAAGVRFDQDALPDGWIRDGALSWKPILNPFREGHKILTQAEELINSGRFAEAREQLNTFLVDYADTDAAPRAQRLLEQIKLLGTPAPALEAEEWYTKAPKNKPSKATLVVFWEVWCPHCQREVPELQAIADTWSKQGLSVVALTRLTRNTTPEAVQGFIEEHHLSFPIGRESGAIAEAFGVRGIPAAAVVKDGLILWQGHPASIEPAMLEAWVK